MSEFIPRQYMPLRIAVVGVGKWGINHLRTLDNIRERGGDIELHACDIDSTRKGASQPIRATWHEDISSLISSKLIDAAVIATPSDTHVEISLELLSHGIHLLVEKPLGAEPEDTAEVLSCATENGRELAIGLQLRFHPSIIEARRLLRQGEIGRIEQIICKRYSTRKSQGISKLIENLGIHYLDLCCHLVGEIEPESVCLDYEEDDCMISARAALEFQTGIEGLCNIGWGHDEDISSVELIGTEATIEIDLHAHDSIIISDKSTIKQHVLSQNMSPLESQLNHFLSRLRDRAGSVGPMADAGAVLRSTRLVSLAKQSVSKPIISKFVFVPQISFWG